MLTSVPFCLLLFVATRIIYSQAACSCEQPNSDFANGVNLIYYKCNGETPNATITYPITAPQSLVGVLDSNKRTIFYVFGFLQTPTDSNVETMTKALCYGDTDNVVLLDWSKYSTNIDYASVFKNAEGVGSLFARSLQLLKDNDFNTSTIYIIGHSLGAHISGLAGKCTNFTIPRITGLDPANRLWYPTGCYLESTDASWVDVIHTDMGVWGTPECMGTADYFANTGTTVQPGCPFNSTSQGITGIVFCSHQMSVVIYAESKYNPDEYVAVCCSSFTSFMLNVCKTNAKTGVGYAASNVTGTYYFNTTKSLF
ncbi:pancreatic triacylglycerol lipase-like [Ooceraea biroi]|uniref:pancreatic triacylglycerol lipase-like n=1 Tax=Ooceraea biroi TaxID=2015173 RepID=UPI000F0994E8|nr:pancreatic triacylglycerol lipase-like [Ooceraea biroi]